MPIQGHDRRPTHDERPAKRSRVSRACDQCRTAREKCDGGQPGCLTCSAVNRPCTYTTAPKKRGIQPGYIRTLELTLTWLFQNTDCETTLNRKLAQEGNASVFFGRSTRESNKLHKSWRKSRFCKQVDKLLSGEQANDDAPLSEEEDSDPEVEHAMLQDRLPPLHQEDLSPSAHFITRRTSHPVQRHSPSIHNSVDVSGGPSRHTTKLTTLPSNTWRLLDVYFAYTQSWLPICEKHEMLRVSYTYPKNGLELYSAELAHRGDHAELWSVLAVAAHQARTLAQEPGADMPLHPSRVYRIARELIPYESAALEAGHVRALLNLAVVSIGCMDVNTAWLLVGTASRIVSLLSRSSQTQLPRWKHLMAGCFVLDSFVSLQLHTHTHLRQCDIDAAGRIEENGLEEWQPWVDPLQHTSGGPSRTPALSLSSFNNLLRVIDILNLCNSGDSSATSSHRIIGRLESWTSCLPPNLGYVNDCSKTTPHNPPAMLLHMAYFTATSVSASLGTEVERILHFIDRYVAQPGIAAVPPVVVCLLGYLQTTHAYKSLDTRIQNRLRDFQTDIFRAWSPTLGEDALILPPLATLIHPRPSAAYEMPTPESIQVSFNSPFALPSNRLPKIHESRATATTFIDDLLPDMNPAVSTVRASFSDPRMPSFSTHSGVQESPLHLHNPTDSRDLETFFDELASLDGAEKVDNQPQFMQNLGFAPDANMADFLAMEFGQFAPTNTGSFMPHSGDLTQLDPTFFGPS